MQPDSIAGHNTALPTDCSVNAALIACHQARVKGGVGLIRSQVAGIYDSARYISQILMAVDDGCIVGFAKLAHTVQAAGARIFVQLFHQSADHGIYQ